MYRSACELKREACRRGMSRSIEARYRRVIMRGVKTRCGRVIRRGVKTRCRRVIMRGVKTRCRRGMELTVVDDADCDDVGSGSGGS